jgi:hypothetical protein
MRGALFTPSASAAFYERGSIVVVDYRVLSRRMLFG